MSERKLKILALLVPLLFFFGFAKEVHIATKYAQVAGLNFTETIELWGREKSTSENFSGAQLGTIVRVDRAVYTFIIFGLICFITYGGLRFRALAN